MPVARPLLPALGCALGLFGAMAFPDPHPKPVYSAAGPQYNSFWRQASAADFRTWTAGAVTVRETASGPAVQLAPRGSGSVGCWSRDVDGGSARYSAAAGLCQGTDPMTRGSYGRAISYYNGGSFYFGTLRSPVHRPGHPIDHLIASWNAETPPGTWLEVHVRALEGVQWTGWYSLGIWSADLTAIHRHSVDHQGNRYGGVDTDTFHTPPERSASAYQVSVTLFTTSRGVSPTLRLIAVAATRDATAYPRIGADTSVWGTNLRVPPRSQMLPRYHGLGYGGGGEVWCSPTTTSMIMAYWAALLHRSDLNRPVPRGRPGNV